MQNQYLWITSMKNLQVSMQYINKNVFMHIEYKHSENFLSLIQMKRIYLNISYISMLTANFHNCTLKIWLTMNQTTLTREPKQRLKNFFSIFNLNYHKSFFLFSSFNTRHNLGLIIYFIRYYSFVLEVK